MIVDEKELLKQVMKHFSDSDNEYKIQKVCDSLIEEMYQCFLNGDSIRYTEYPLFKVKKSSDKINIGSPRTPRNDRIIVSVKIPLNTKDGVSDEN